MIRGWWLALAALLLAPAAVAQDLARETARVEDLRSIREIKRLQAEWGYRALAGDWRGMADLGTDDVRMALPGGDAVGRAALEQSLRERQGKGADGMPAGRLNIRLYFSPVLTLAPDGQSATGRWHHLALTGEEGVSAQWLGTTDVIHYRNTAAGWQIATIRPYLQFSGPYEGGWRHDAATLERAPYHYTPDQAGTVLPGRPGPANPAAADVLALEATLLLRQSTAQNLANAYGYYLDRGMYEDIADLFAPDAQIEVAGQGGYDGAAGVRRFLARYGAPGLDEGELNDRPQLMPLVNVSDDGTTAIVRVVELGMTGQHGGEGLWSAAINTFLLRADPNGRWRIQHLHQRPLLRAAYEQGWAHPLSAQMPIDEDLWPDRPPPSEDSVWAHPREMEAVTFGVIFPSYDPAGPVPLTANALEMAEAFDGAENVANAYGYYIDQFAWAQTAALFAKDGWKELSYIGTFVGREQVLQSLITRYGEGGPRNEFQAIHQKTQPVVTVAPDGRTAHVRTRLLQFNSSSTGPGSWIGGIYENQVVKDEDGVWRIHGMDLDYVWLADYATGWTGIDPEASKRFAPPPEQLARFDIDAPLRGETFAPYPRIAPMGFHYANPVSGREPPVKLEWSAGYPPELEPE